MGSQPGNSCGFEFQSPGFRLLSAPGGFAGMTIWSKCPSTRKKLYIRISELLIVLGCILFRGATLDLKLSNQQDTPRIVRILPPDIHLILWLLEPVYIL